MNADAKHYLELVKALEEKHTHTLMEQGMPEKTARAKASKIGQTRTPALYCPTPARQKW